MSIENFKIRFDSDGIARIDLEYLAGLLKPYLIQPKKECPDGSRSCPDCGGRLVHFRYEPSTATDEKIKGSMTLDELIELLRRS